MRMTLIYTNDANSQEDRLYPGLDGSAKIKIETKDGESVRYMVQTIKCLDTLANGRTEFPFWLDGIRDRSWEVIVTDQRIAFHNPFSKGLFGKAKEKQGKASVGHIYYKSICNLSTFFSQESGNPVLICACYRNDKTRSAISIESNCLDDMKKMAEELHSRINKWITENNRKIIIDDKTDEEIKTVVNNWDTFLDKIWTTKNATTTVFVPCDEWDKVVDSII